MTWRDYTWEFTVAALSWVVALGALALIAAYVAYEALQRRRAARQAAKRAS